MASRSDLDLPDGTRLPTVLETPLVGCPEPRIGTPAFGDDRRATEIIGFASDLGLELLPWQKTLFRRSLAMTGDRWVHRTILAITARQNAKTTSAAVRALAELVLWDGRLVIQASQSRDVSLHSFRYTCELAESAGLDIVKIRRAVGSEELVLGTYNGHVSLKVVSSTSGGARGLSPDLVICDELASMKSHEPFGALEKARRARPNSQCWCITSEGTHESVVLDALKEQGRAAAESGTPGPIGFYEWSAREDRAPDDPEGWRESNPALGHLISADVIAAELQTDAPANFEREVLCRRTAVARSWLPPNGWEACTDASAQVPDGAEVVFAVDAGPTLQHVSVCVAWPRPDGRTHTEAVAAFDGPTATTEAEKRLLDLLSRWKPRCLAVVGKGPAEAVAARVAAATGTELTAVGGADLDRASRGFYEAVTAARIVHPPDALLASHFEAAEAGAPGLFTLRNQVAPIDAAVAAVIATWCAERAPATPKFAWSAY